MSDDAFGRYHLQELLGEGGMGQVYRAFDTETDRVVALKLLPPHLVKDREFERRFRREAKIAASLSDPHIVPIHHFGEIDGRLYVDMRLIAGQDLAELLKQRTGGLQPAKAVAYIEQLAEALHAAHDAGLVHRDVKPSNVLITDRDFVYLIDFGIAQSAEQTRFTSSGLAIGTFAYMAPERMSSGTADTRSDIYALACVLHECLTGKPPFAGSGVEQIVAAHLMTEPPKPSNQRSDIAESFDAVISKGMAKDPAGRYQTTIELAAAARGALTSAGAPKRTSAPSPSKKVIPSRAGDTVSATKFAASGADTKKRVPSSTPPKPQKRSTASSTTNEQRRAAAKQKLKQKLETRMRLRRYILAGSIVAAVLVLGAVVATVIVTNKGSNSNAASASPSSSSSSSTSASAVPAPPADGKLPPFAAPADLGANCQYPATTDPASKPNTPPRTGKVPTDPAEVSASMTTSQGNIGLQLDNAKAPCTVNNFASLAQQGYFNDTPCHRLTTGGLAVLQCGDPTGQGSGGPGYQFANEYPTTQYQPDNPALQQPVLYPRGTLAMANAGPGTNGSQFFLVYQDSQLPPNYTVFGTIDQTGLATLDKIAAGGVDGGGDGKPKLPVQIKSIQLD
jgi:serine/threonine protein kinase